MHEAVLLIYERHQNVSRPLCCLQAFVLMRDATWMQGRHSDPAATADEYQIK